MSNTAYIDFIRENKSGYKRACDVRTPLVPTGYIDPDNDFLIGESGGFLMNMSFDFTDTYKFSEMARVHKKHGKYTNAEVDSAEHSHIRLQETRRRRIGITFQCKLQNGVTKPLRITGDHYNFLNYSQMRGVIEESTETGSYKTAEKDDVFPRFFGGQYWFFKVREFARANGLHLVIGKSRRGGFSYIMGASAGNNVNLHPGTTHLLAAYDKKYLTKANATARMAYNQLNWYENSTQSLFKRGWLKRNLEDLQLGYKTPDGDIDPDCWGSFIPSVSFGPDNPGAAVGKDASEINIEELNDTPNLGAFMGVTEPLTRAGSYVTGMIVGWGTGGSKAGNWQQFEEWFYQPELYGAMAFENVWDEGARHTLCGYYKPYWENLEGRHPTTGQHAMDKNGNSNYEVAMAISDNERKVARKTKSGNEYIMYCAQYANYPAESFSAGSENIFSSPELNAHIEQVRYNPELNFHVDGTVINDSEGYTFRSNSYLEARETPIHPYLETVPFRQGEDIHGCLRQWYPPLKVKGVIPPNLYRVTYDPVGVSKDKEEVTIKNSLNSLTVRMLPNDIVSYRVPENGLIVAKWCGRTNSMDDDDTILLNTAEYYNAKILAEMNRGQVLKDFTDWKKLDKLVLNPMNVLDKKISGKSYKSYGIVITGDMKLNGLSYVRDSLYKKIAVGEGGKSLLGLHFINDLPTLIELQKFSNQKNCDRISDMILQEYDKQANIIMKVKALVGGKESDARKFIQNSLSKFK